MAVSRALRLLLGLALSGAVFGALPVGASASTISGTVTEAAAPNNPISAIRVCSENAAQATGEAICTSTDGNGHYVLVGLPDGARSVQFSDRVQNRNFVDQYFGGGFKFPGTPVTLSGNEEFSGANAALAAGSSISGTVTDADSHAPVAGMFACPEAEFPSGGFYQRCDETGVDGKYQVNGLPPGEYRVQLQSGLGNYQELTVPPLGEPKIAIAAANETKTQDAEAHVGAEISGTVREVGTGKPIANLMVELIHPLPKGGEGNRIAFTDANGHYLIRALPEDEDIIVFAPPSGPFGTSGGFYSTQYYKGSATLAGATVLHAVPGKALTGIDGELVNLNPPKEPVKVALLPTPQLLPKKHKPVRCHRGFKKRKVHGKQRCVKVHKHHKRKHHRSHS